MPLSERARIEVYLPDLPTAAYQNLLDALDQKFSHAFGGCTIIQGLSGSYLSTLGLVIQDRVNLVYTDTPFSLQDNFELISHYMDEIRSAADEALEEEAILVAVQQVYHSTA